MLGELTGRRVVPDVALRVSVRDRSAATHRRGTDQTADSVPFRVLICQRRVSHSGETHFTAVDAQHRILAVELEQSKGLGELRFPCAR